MNLPICHLESSRATIVPMPEIVSTVPMWNPHNAATRTVAGNIVSTCWNPNSACWTGGGASLGRYPMSPLLATAFPDFAVLFLGLAIALLLFRFNWSIQCQATGDNFSWL